MYGMPTTPCNISPTLCVVCLLHLVIFYIVWIHITAVGVELCVILILLLLPTMAKTRNVMYRYNYAIGVGI